jgi:hypothetical protein
VRDYDAVSGVPFENFFKKSVQDILDRREHATALSMKRSLDPLSHTFPTASLEETRVYEDQLNREALVAHHLAKMPLNEQRSRSRSLNVITGECSDESVAQASLNDFPNSNPTRSVRAITQESKIVAEREKVRSRELSRVSCRYNGNRARLELRDWNVINEAPVNPVLSDEVKYRPPTWDWCVMESLPS